MYGQSKQFKSILVCSNNFFLKKQLVCTFSGNVPTPIPPPPYTKLNNLIQVLGVMYDIFPAGGTSVFQFACQTRTYTSLRCNTTLQRFFLIFCSFVLLSFCPFFLLSSCPFVLLSLSSLVLLSFCTFVLLSFCPFVLMSYK